VLLNLFCDDPNIKRQVIFIATAAHHTEPFFTQLLFISTEYTNKTIQRKNKFAKVQIFQTSPKQGLQLLTIATMPARYSVWHITAHLSEKKLVFKPIFSECNFCRIFTKKVTNVAIFWILDRISKTTTGNLVTQNAKVIASVYNIYTFCYP